MDKLAMCNALISSAGIAYIKKWKIGAISKWIHAWDIYMYVYLVVNEEEQPMQKVI